MVLTKRAFTLAATSLGSSLAFIDGSAVIVALPTIQKKLGLGLTGLQWIILAYSLAIASLYLIAGSLGDRYGHRKMFRLGALGFGLTSILAGLSPSGAWLIAARALQGITGAFLTTNSLAWLRSVYGKDSGKAVGLWTSLTSISIIIAPPLGGALTEWLSWRWIFIINIPLVVIVLFWATRAVADQKSEEPKLPLDILGSLFIALGLGFLTYYLVEGAKTGFGKLWWSLLIGIVGLISFIVTESRIKHPMLPLNLFRIRNFWSVNLQTLLVYGALNGILVYFTLYLQFQGLSPLTSSVFLIPTSVVLVLLAAYFGKLADKHGPKWLLTVGPTLIGVGSLVLTLINSKSDIWVWGSIGIAIFAIGLAMLVAPITTAALKSVPSKFSGIASGVNNAAARIGGLIAVALIGLVISVTFYSKVSDHKAIPLGLTQTSRVERQASHQGYKNGSWITAGLAFGGAVIAAGLIKNQTTPRKKL